MKLNEKSMIGIIGAGTMGKGIAQIAATNGHQVILFDKFKESLETAKKSLVKILNRLQEKGKISEKEKVQILTKIEFTDDISKIKPCDLVIEAVIEELELKKAIFEEVESLVSEGTLLATNTSSLSIASISAALDKPERFLGIHFFNPAPVMPLVEIIPSFITEDKVTKAAKQLIDKWGKTTVLAKDTPGFIVNRVARPFYGEAMRIYEEGFADIPTIDWAMKEIGGFKMGPFELTDYIGHDVNYKVSETVFEQFYYDPRFKPSLVQKRLVEAGYLGRKTGKGFYDYSNNAKTPEPTRDKKLGKDIVVRILVMLINEAADAVHLKIATKEDIDLAMTKGVNYPKGLLHWADELGLDFVIRKLRELQESYGEDRYRSNYLLKKMKEDDESFFD